MASISMRLPQGKNQETGRGLSRPPPCFFVGVPGGEEKEGPGGVVAMSCSGGLRPWGREGRQSTPGASTWEPGPLRVGRKTFLCPQGRGEIKGQRRAARSRNERHQDPPCLFIPVPGSPLAAEKRGGCPPLLFAVRLSAGQGLLSVGGSPGLRTKFVNRSPISAKCQD